MFDSTCGIIVSKKYPSVQELNKSEFGGILKNNLSRLARHKSTSGLLETL